MTSKVTTEFLYVKYFVNYLRVILLMSFIVLLDNNFRNEVKGHLTVDEVMKP